MIESERIFYILNQLKEKETVSLKDIANKLDVSVATIRRDFQKLDQKKLAVKVRGGVTRANLGTGTNMVPLLTSEKSKENIDAKIAIAKKAASFIHNGDCIFLDGGTTIAPMIDFIQEKKIKIVTHNILILQRIKNIDVDIFLIGGHYSHFHASTVGVNAERMVSQFHFDHAFFGCSGIELTHQFAYNDDIDTILMKEIAMKYTEKSHLLADASKLGMTSYCRFSPLTVFDTIISNRSDGFEGNLPPNFIFAEDLY